MSVNLKAFNLLRQGQSTTVEHVVYRSKDLPKDLETETFFDPNRLESKGTRKNRENQYTIDELKAFLKEWGDERIPANIKREPLVARVRQKWDELHPTV